MITLGDFIESGSRCAGPYDNYLGTAVKILNDATYTVPYNYTQRRLIRERYRRQMNRATKEDKKNYGMFCVVLGAVVVALILVMLYKGLFV